MSSAGKNHKLLAAEICVIKKEFAPKQKIPIVNQSQVSVQQTYEWRKSKSMPMSLRYPKKLLFSF